MNTSPLFIPLTALKKNIIILKCLFYVSPAEMYIQISKQNCILNEDKYNLTCSITYLWIYYNETWYRMWLHLVVAYCNLPKNSTSWRLLFQQTCLNNLSNLTCRLVTFLLWNPNSPPNRCKRYKNVLIIILLCIFTAL